VHRLLGQQLQDGGTDVAARRPAATSVAVPARAELGAAPLAGTEAGFGTPAELGAELGAGTAVAARVVGSVEATEVGVRMHEVVLSDVSG
jgi:hypothetical protein